MADRFDRGDGMISGKEFIASLKIGSKVYGRGAISIERVSRSWGTVSCVVSFASFDANSERAEIGRVMLVCIQDLNFRLKRSGDVGRKSDLPNG